MKNGIKIGLISVVLAGNIFAMDSFKKQIVVNADSENGQKIVNNIEEYNEYMDDKTRLALGNKLPIDQLSEHSCDINKLKEAIAKIIIRLEKVESKTDIEDLKNKIKDLELQIANKTEPVTPKTVCKIKKVPVTGGGKEDPSHYIKFKKDTFFKAEYKIPQYSYPVIDSDIEGTDIEQNEKFKADMYTKAGWVHIENKGWVKGYALIPKFEASKEYSKHWKKGKKQKIRYKEVSDCQTVN